MCADIFMDFFCLFYYSFGRLLALLSERIYNVSDIAYSKEHDAILPYDQFLDFPFERFYDEPFGLSRCKGC